MYHANTNRKKDGVVILIRQIRPTSVQRKWPKQIEYFRMIKSINQKDRTITDKYEPSNRGLKHPKQEPEFFKK